MHKVIGLTPRELWEYTQTHRNHHWTPQSVLHAGVPCRLVRLEDMPGFWEDMTQTKHPFPRVNSTEGAVIMDVPLVNDIKAYYADDIKLWEAAREYY
jgi:hypothetical protein